MSKLCTFPADIDILGQKRRLVIDPPSLPREESQNLIWVCARCLRYVRGHGLTPSQVFASSALFASASRGAQGFAFRTTPATVSLCLARTAVSPGVGAAAEVFGTPRTLPPFGPTRRRAMFVDSYCIYTPLTPGVIDKGNGRHRETRYFCDFRRIQG